MYITLTIFADIFVYIHVCLHKDVSAFWAYRGFLPLQHWSVFSHNMYCFDYVVSFHYISYIWDITFFRLIKSLLCYSLNPIVRTIYRPTKKYLSWQAQCEADPCFLTTPVCFSVICSSSHLSAILAHVGLSSHHGPDVVIQASIKYDTKRNTLG